MNRAEKEVRSPRYEPQPDGSYLDLQNGTRYRRINGVLYSVRSATEFIAEINTVDEKTYKFPILEGINPEEPLKNMNGTPIKSNDGNI